MRDDYLSRDVQAKTNSSEGLVFGRYSGARTNGSNSVGSAEGEIGSPDS